MNASTDILGFAVFGYRDLRREGLTRAQINAQLDAGTLLRVRRDRYLAGHAPASLHESVGYGGRLDCVSLLRELGVFVLAKERLHVQVERGSARLPPRPPHVAAHWRVSDATRRHPAVPVLEALAQAVRCQDPRAAVATLDSALHLGFLRFDQLDELFARLPTRYRALRGLLDPRSESGPESLLRLILRQLGCVFDIQVHVRGVGRVDFLANGWLIIECDSRAFHSDWMQHREDRRRDRAAAEAGYVTLRVMAEDILYRPETVTAAIRGVLVPRRRR